MPYNDLECVTLTRKIQGEESYVGGHYTIPAGTVGTIVDGLVAGRYEVEFLLTDAKGLFSIVMEVAEADLAPYVENAV